MHYPASAQGWLADIYSAGQPFVPDTRRGGSPVIWAAKYRGWEVRITKGPLVLADRVVVAV